MRSVSTTTCTSADAGKRQRTSVSQQHTRPTQATMEEIDDDELDYDSDNDENDIGDVVDMDDDESCFCDESSKQYARRMACFMRQQEQIETQQAKRLQEQQQQFSRMQAAAQQQQQQQQQPNFHGVTAQQHAQFAQQQKTSAPPPQVSHQSVSQQTVSASHQPVVHQTTQSSQQQMLKGFLQPVQWNMGALPMKPNNEQELSRVFDCSKNKDRNKLYVIVFKRPGCPACGKYDAAADQLYNAVPGVQFVEVNVTATTGTGQAAFANYMQNLRINAVPTFILLKGCAEIMRIQGFGPQQHHDLLAYMSKLH